MALDGGGSSTLAFEGTVLNSPSEGKERATSTALMLQYYGCLSPPPLEQVVSPNGDGVAEEQALAYKVVRPSTVTVTLAAPDGAGRGAGVRRREPGSYDVAFRLFRRRRPHRPRANSPAPTTPLPLPRAAGRSRSPRSTTRLSSTATRRFAVNSTLGFLKIEPTRSRSSEKRRSRRGDPLDAERAAR